MSLLAAVGVLAHPMVETEVLPVPPLLVVALAVTAVAAAGRVTPPGEAAHEGTVARDSDRLTGLRLLTRVLGLGLLVLAIVAGRIGRDSTIANITPSLVLGVGLPALVAASVFGGNVWRWLDPWDTLARVFGRLGRRDEDEVEVGPQPVWLAVVPALLWVGYLGVFPRTYAPSAIGAALALYTVLMLAGCMAFGRRAWLARAEVVGLFLGWCAQLPRAQLQHWRPPAGAAVVLGVLAGGLTFAALRHSALWFTLATSPRAQLWYAVGAAVSCAVAAAALWWLERDARRYGAAGTVAAATVPATAGIALAFSLSQDRLIIAAQLLVSRVSDPFGFGWDLFGTAGFGLWTPGLPVPARVFAQVALLVLGGVAGMVIARRRLGAPRGHGPALGAVALLVGAAAVAVTTL